MATTRKPVAGLHEDGLVSHLSDRNKSWWCWGCRTWQRGGYRYVHSIYHFTEGNSYENRKALGLPLMSAHYQCADCQQGRLFA